MDIILTLYNDLKKIRINLIKLGPKRRIERVLEKKLIEIDAIYQQYETWLIDFNDKVKKKCYSSQDILLIQNHCREFLDLHEDILLLCQSDKSDYFAKMGSFDLTIALNLLPVMTNEESNTKQLIDNIVYYNSILKENSCKQNLINFVLKSRLSQEAKIKLKAKYDTVDELINDMRSVLLCKKAATAIQNKLQRLKQNESSIADYGKDITELFVDLTIAQADGNDQCYNILKPINEQTAIKQFASGLRNRRLSTIISARNYSSLKDAVQAAQDEEVTIGAPSGEVMGMYKQPYNNFYNRNHSNNYRGQRGGRSNFYSYRGRGRGAQHGAHFASRGQWTRGGTTGRKQYRGKFYNSNRGNQGMRKERNVNLMQNSETAGESQVTSNQFFRE